MECYRVGMATPKEGKRLEATEAIIKLAEYCRETFKGDDVTFEVCNTMDGTPRLLWVERWKSLADFERTRPIWAADPMSKKWAKQSAALLVDGGETHFYPVLTK